MPDETRYETALLAAWDILQRLDAQPGASLPVRLSLVVYLVLDAIHEAEGRPGLS